MAACMHNWSQTPKPQSCTGSLETVGSIGSYCGWYSVTILLPFSSFPRWSNGRWPPVLWSWDVLSAQWPFEWSLPQMTRVHVHVAWSKGACCHKRRSCWECNITMHAYKCIHKWIPNLAWNITPVRTQNMMKAFIIYVWSTIIFDNSQCALIFLYLCLPTPWVERHWSKAISRISRDSPPAM